MATITPTAVKRYSSGNQRQVTFRISAAAATGEIQTGLTRVDHVWVEGVDTQDKTVAVYRNATSASDNDGEAGWIHLTGMASAPSVYHVGAIGV